VVREAVEALNLALATGDDSGLDALVAADVTVEPRHRMLATGEEVSDDLAGLKVALADMRNIATDIELVVDDLIAEEDKVAGRFTVRGTLGASGQPLEGRGLVFAVVADDRVTELWIYPDPYLMMDVMALVGMATPVPSA
jgi:ketosteroid isomerase-like protein